MLNISQKTINSKISCSSVALHSGKIAKITLLPAPINAGIIFRRIDLEAGKNEIKANFLNVKTTNLGTMIANEFEASVSTIEHLMAAIWGCGVDNLIIEIDNLEVPIMDGSSAPFVFLLECAGIHAQEEDRKIIEILEPVRFENGDKFIEVSPAKNFALDLEIEFNHSQIEQNRLSYCSKIHSFKHDISRARTFCFEKEIEQMRKIGLAKGGSLDNAIVIGDDKLLNDEGLRMPDEFIRHKALDFIGDILLAGHQIIGQFNARKIGHGINNQFLHHLFSQKQSWRLV